MSDNTHSSTNSDRPARPRHWYHGIPIAGRWMGGGTTTLPVIRLSGVIGQVGGVRRGGMTLTELAQPIHKAFADKQVPAVALLINSPGGSPVQSAQIATRIRQLADENGTRVLAFCEDAAASGGYWLACAADEIYADGASVVGSIGVVSAGFGFPEALEKLGIERRVYTAGERKGMLDPFQPERAEDVAHLKSLQADLHELFKDYVRTRRGDRLTASEEELFSGAFWSGRKAVELGLVDGLGDLRGILRARYGKEVRPKLMNTPKRGLQKLFSGNAAWGAWDGGAGSGGWGGELIAAAESRLYWSRLGL